jgi:hypothetical protein
MQVFSLVVEPLPQKGVLQCSFDIIDTVELRLYETAYMPVCTEVNYHSK